MKTVIASLDVRDKLREAISIDMNEKLYINLPPIHNLFPKFAGRIDQKNRPFNGFVISHHGYLQQQQ